MGIFEQHAQAPPTEEEWLRREEDIGRSEERRLLALDLAYEYGHETREFTGKHAANVMAETGCTVEEIEGAFPTTAREFMRRFGAPHAKEGLCR